MASTFLATVKRFCRNWLGDNVTSFIHAFRFYYRNVSGYTRRTDIALATLDRYIGEGDIVVDVGANNANWSYRMASLVGPSGKVFAFEAHPYYALATERTLRLHRLRNVELFPFGLSDKVQRALMRDVDDSGRQMSGRSHIVRTAGAAGGTKPLEIELRPLDDLVADHPQLARVRYIKIDTEGFEYFVVRGAATLVQRARPLILAETGHAGLHGIDDDRLFEALFAQGYTAHAFAADGSLQAISGFADIADTANKDVLFVPKAAGSPAGTDAR